MKASQIKVGGFYKAKISGVEVTVRVDAIRDGDSLSLKRYDVTNLTTGRKTTFRSAAKFRGEAKPDLPTEEDEQGSDPTNTPDAPASGTPSGLPSSTSLGSILAAKMAPKVNTIPHVIVVARAGSGKTTTLVEGLKKVKGLPVSITPSPQQAAVWEAMMLSRSARTICFVAFNKSIATELQKRVPQGCDAMTMHSMGYRAVTKAFGRQEPNDWVVQDHLAAILGVDLREWKKKPENITVVQGVERLVSLCKMNLVGLDFPPATDEGTALAVKEFWTEALDDLCDHYTVDLNGSREKVYELVPQVLELCKEPKGKISFDDMIWLPVVHKLPVFRYDLLLVDEAQDLNRCQQALAKMAGSRLILCGDPRQAIYGFAGADADSMPRMERELGETVSGCMQLPLTVTRRCGKAIVREANNYVRDFEAHESNSEGVINRATFNVANSPRDYMVSVEYGDMILCRTNAPLVSECFKYIKAGRKANIQGRDIGRGLISTVEKLKAADVSNLIEKLGNWLSNEQAKETKKRNPSENRLTALQDRHDCLLCFTSGLAPTAPVSEVVAKINSVFTDDKDCPGIKLSSIHKAKGLESDCVFYLKPKGGPRLDRMKPWELQQEQNLAYVAITRAIHELTYVIEG